MEEITGFPHLYVIQQHQKDNNKKKHLEMVLDFMSAARSLILLLLAAGWQNAVAQDISKFKILSDSAYQTTTEYQEGNK